MLVEQQTMPQTGQFVMMWEFNGKPWSYVMMWSMGVLYQCIPPRGDSDLKWERTDPEELPTDTYVNNIRYLIVEED